MNEPIPTQALLERLDSLADETRLRILLLCEAHELGVAEICEIVQLPQSTVSRHLRVLADLGWLQSRRLGTSHLYRLSSGLDEGARRLWSLARESTREWTAAEHDALRLSTLLSRRRAGADAFFAGAATRWEDVRADLYGRAYEAAGLAALLPASWVVADLGCGTGVLSRALAERVARVFAVDASSAMLDAARRTLEHARNVDIRAGELEALPIESASCDAALMLLALTYVPAPAQALREAARILKPQGRLVIVDLLHHEREDFRYEMGHVHPGFDPGRLADDIGQAGFDAVACRPLPAEARVRGPALLLASGDRRGRVRLSTRRGRAPARRTSR